MPRKQNEYALIAKAVSGDMASLEILLFRHRKRLLAYIQGHFPPELRGFLEPQDVVQDTWLKAIRALREFRPDGPEAVYRWLVTISRNLILDHAKHVQMTRRKEPPGPAVNADDASIIRLLEEMAVYQRTPSKSAASHELMKVLDDAIERLPGDQARALRLRHLQGLETKAIALQMQRSEGSISMLCNRALRSLRWELRSASIYI